jgi:hypothetical protein
MNPNDTHQEEHANGASVASTRSASRWQDDSRKELSSMTIQTGTRLPGERVQPIRDDGRSACSAELGPRWAAILADDHKFCRLIWDYLGPLGCEIQAVHTGPEGAEAAVSQSWQVAILDLMLSG